MDRNVSPSVTICENNTPNDTVRHRMRRVNSITVANAYREEKIQRNLQPDRPLHECRDSLFSASSNFQNYRGFLNLALIMLALCTGRVALENVIKYGILVDPMQIFRLFFGGTSIWPTLFTLFAVNIFILFSFHIEKQLSRSEITEEKALRHQIGVCGSVIIFPVLMVFVIEMHPISASIACTLYSMVFLKLVSYHMVNYWCRQFRVTNNYNKYRERRKSSDNITVPNMETIILNNIKNNVNSNHYNSKKYKNNNHKHLNGSAQTRHLVQYPDNLTYRDLYYFIAAPTLCYELNFPRSERIRKHLLIKRLIEMIFLVQLNMALIQQWIVPTINNSLKPLQEMDYPRMLERLLKLAVPNHFIWLIWFYWYFHSTLNFMAEVLRFGDKEFYRDWWNSESVEYFWKNWNIPVHSWAVRHLYKPLLQSGYNKLSAGIVVFLVSAFFHEYLREVESVMGCGVDTSRIIFANPCKSRAQLRYVKSIGLKLMTFDNEEELMKVSVLYPEAQLVLRIKTDNTYSTSKLSLKFGADIHETEHLLSRAKCLGLNVIGIAFHVGSGCQKSGPYLEAIHKAKNAFNIGINLGFNMTLLDIGGGFLGSAELAKLPFCTVTADINEALDQHFPADSGVTIIAEPGRFYTISAFHLCAQITSKRVVVTDDRTQRLIMYYINDGLYGSFSSVTTGHRSVQPIPVLKDTDRLDSRTQCLSVIWGPTCDSYDCVRSEHLMAEMMVPNIMNDKSYALFRNSEDLKSPINAVLVVIIICMEVSIKSCLREPKYKINKIKNDCDPNSLPFLWEIKSNISSNMSSSAPPNSQSYFFGTIHVPYSRVWDSIPNRVKRAFHNSDNIFFELDLIDGYTVSTLSKCQMLPKGDKLIDILPPDLYRRLKSHLDYVRHKLPTWMTADQRARGLYAEYLYNAITSNWEHKKPVWIMLMINSLTENDIKSRGIPVLDLFLAQEAQRLNKHIGSVEKVEEQCIPLNGLNYSEVLFALNQTLYQHEGIRLGILRSKLTTDDLIRHYNCGDLNEIIFNYDTTHVPNIMNDKSYALFRNSEDLKLAKHIDDYFRSEVIVKRNKRMSERVLNILQSNPNQSYFFAFGAGIDDNNF
ncbi:unnamed protein product [Medioppia subpectinata]|uniref:Metalloprotease TIKI homolog n=1 Tax=Medioppia subpectinata TaxID=1979941 RepID=A0A7R9PY04_9ACAR|nr:unnamed protein product [Medioppia subpectinata]CAG2105571.1 unnamed protein product [Medioppia subpectinata]